MRQGMLFKAFIGELRTQRWDDHRYYHQSRVNQTLHLLSALGFLCAYGVLFIDPPTAALIGWGWSMVTRQSGHFFFEPQGFDQVNQVSNEYKEAVKVGYNLDRKVVLLAIWAGVPALIWFLPRIWSLDLWPVADSVAEFWRQVGWVWLCLGAAGLVWRTVHLVWLRGPLAALAWMSKILTDPFNDVRLYWRSPIALLRGEWLDPMGHVRHG
jgi:hypothetical protein